MNKSFVILRNCFFLILFFLVYCVNIGFAQDWVDKIENKKDHTFQEIQTSFNEFWTNKAIEKGHGYKQFKRWEWYWKDRVLPDGSFPNDNLKLSEFNSFKRQFSSTNRALMATWTNMGPSSSNGGYAGVGRVNAVGFHPTNTNLIYVGAAGGGLWQTNDGGSNWFTNTDDIGSLGVSGIVVNETSPNTIYIATGDGDGYDNYSVGVLKSTDGGVTFNSTGLSWNTSSGRIIRRIIADPNDVNTLFVASNIGIFRTTNAGVSWTNVQSGSFSDVEAKHGSSSNTFYASTSRKVFRSTDNGSSWSDIYTINQSNRLAITTSPDNDNYLYVLSSDSLGSGYRGVWRSDDSGNTFSNRSTSPNILHWSSTGNGTGGQGWYDLAFVADPNDAEVIYVGGVNTWRSANGGTNWALKTHWSGSNGVQTVHADKHVLVFNGTDLWEGNDGGIYKSANDGDTWSHLTNGMQISQMYKIGVSQQGTKVIAGLQDNGTKLLGNSGNWTDEIGGDGMDCAIDPSNNDVMYGELYYGEIKRSTNGGGSWTDIQDNMPNDPSGGWVTPFVLDPTHPDTIVVGMKHVFRSLNKGTTWTEIGTNIVGGSNLTYTHIAPSNPDYIYVGIGDEMHRTINGGTSWTEMTVPGNSTKMIAIHPSNPDSLWAVRSNYTSGAKVYVSADGGASWTNISSNLPNIPVNCIVYQKGTANGIYIGMDIGVYYTDDNIPNWELFTDLLPNVEITDLEINYNESKIYAGTYGRGLWKSDLNTAAITCIIPLNVSVDSFRNGDAYVSWDPPNTPPGAGYEYAVTTSLNPPGSGTFIASTDVIVTGLMGDTDYYLHVRSDCSNNDFSSWITEGPFKLPPGCGNSVYDTGGANSNYTNNEIYATTICPESTNSYVTLTFNDFHVETDWDALYIHDGPNIIDPMFDSGNPASSFGFPAGGYWGHSIPGPFTSTHSTGCLTMQFMSDVYVNDEGWDIDISCSDGCSATAVTTTEDYISGSLRNMIECSTGGSIPFALSLLGDTLQLDEPIIIDKNIILNIGVGNNINIKSNYQGSIFSIAPFTSFNIDNFTLIGMNNNQVVYNEGNLIIGNLIVKGLNTTIINKGVLELNANSIFEIKE